VEQKAGDIFVVGEVACNQDQIVLHRRGSNQEIESAVPHALSLPFEVRSQSSAAPGNVR